MKCPKCDLVTFDHLPQCPACNASFRLNRVLTRRRRDPSRPIYLPSASPRETSATIERPEPRTDEGTRVPVVPLLPTGSVAASVVGATTPVVPSTTDSSAAPVEPEIKAAPEPQPVEMPAAAVAITVADADVNDRPSLGELAAVERRRALAASSNRQPAASTLVQPAPTDAAATDSHSRDAHALKERMMRASRARRKRRPDLISETVDPALPGWYEPGVETPVAEPVTTGSWSDR